MFKHKETPTPPPFLVSADSQRSGISQLWKLVSMETRVGRRVMMLLAEQQSRISHVFQCLLMWAYRRQTEMLFYLETSAVSHCMQNIFYLL